MYSHVSTVDDFDEYRMTLATSYGMHMVPDDAWSPALESMAHPVGFLWAMRFTKIYKFNVVDHLGDRAISLHMQFDPVGRVDLSIHHITLLRA